MNDTAKLTRVRDLARSKMLELQPFAGEEMNLPHTNVRRDGFLDGERTFAARVLEIIEDESDDVERSEFVEDEMVLGR